MSSPVFSYTHRPLEEYRDSFVDRVERLEVIRVLSVFGEGTDLSPVRQITEYFDTEGCLLARVDPQKRALS